MNGRSKMHDREIVLDTETTGLDPFKGDRLVEVGCVELSDKIPTGRTFHVYVNPERDVPNEAFQIHGLSTEFLKGQKNFHEVADDFLEFIEDTILVIHNAEFDIKFLNSELQRINRSAIDMKRVVDTLSLARQKHPGSPNSLDALCSRYRVNNTKRTKHGALLDSELLAEVYLELSGGRQTAIAFKEPTKTTPTKIIRSYPSKQNRKPELLVNRDEYQDHDQFLKEIKGAAVWTAYISKDVNQA